jgi:hypothetical protein
MKQFNVYSFPASRGQLVLPGSPVLGDINVLLLPFLIRTASQYLKRTANDRQGRGNPISSPMTSMGHNRGDDLWFCARIGQARPGAYQHVLQLTNKQE